MKLIKSKWISGQAGIPILTGMTAISVLFLGWDSFLSVEVYNQKADNAYTTATVAYIKDSIDNRLQPEIDAIAQHQGVYRNQFNGTTTQYYEQAKR